MREVDVAIVGAGIAGLTVATVLQRAGLTATVLEASGHVGGAIRTHSEGGFIAECGPNTVMPSGGQFSRLVEMAGLRDHVLGPSDAAKTRYVVRKGRLVGVPRSLAQFLISDILSTRGKLRLLREPFIRSRAEGGEESLADFAVRRFGKEALDYLVSPFASGIYAGDPRRLSVNWAFPKLADKEARFGSVTRGMIAQARTRQRDGAAGALPRLLTFRDGLQQLPRALHRALGGDLVTECPVDRVQRTDEGWRIVAGRTGLSLDASMLVVASGLQDRSWWNGLGGESVGTVAVDHASLTVCSLGFRRSDVVHPLDGFGFLVPGPEGRRLLGTLFASSIFEGRAPEGHVLLTSFVGGACADSGQARGAIADVVLGSLGELIGIRGDPVFQHVHTWPHRIPQYNLGFGNVQSALDRLEANDASLHFAGNYRGGVSVGDTVNQAFSVADRILERWTEEVVV